MAWSLCLVSWIPRVYSSNPEEDFRRLNQLFDQKKFKEARQGYELWLQVNGTHPLRTVVLFNLAHSLEKLNLCPQALSTYKTVMEVTSKQSPTFKDALYRQLSCFEKEAQYEKALVTLGALEGYSLTGYRVSELGLRRWMIETRRARVKGENAPSFEPFKKLYDHLQQLQVRQSLPPETTLVWARVSAELAETKLVRFQQDTNDPEGYLFQLKEIQSKIYKCLQWGDRETRIKGLSLLIDFYRQLPPRDLPKRTKKNLRSFYLAMVRSSDPYIASAAKENGSRFREVVKEVKRLRAQVERELETWPKNSKKSNPSK